MRHAHVAALVDSALRLIESGARADGVLDRVLRSNRDISRPERDAVAQWTLGLALWCGRYGEIARGDRRLRFGLFLFERVGLDDESLALFGFDPARLREVLSAFVSPAKPVDALAVASSLPRWLAKRWIEQLGVERAVSLAKATNVRGPIALRANRLRIDRDGLLARLASEGVQARPSKVAPDGVVLDGRANLFGLEAWREGLFEVQDEASQLVAEAVGARPGETVVDLCAGSGGKTLALAAAMRNTGRIVAVDLEPRRISDVGVRLRRAGVTNVEARVGDALDAALTADLVGRADAVLVDAPCSGLGILRRSPDARWRLLPDEPERWHPVQRRLLEAGAALVRPGGRLVYATCSVDVAENEGVADAFTTSDFERIATRRTWPDREGADGFFIAAWRRRPGELP